MNRYHFSLGGSEGSDPVGYSAAVYAMSPEEAVAILKDELSPLEEDDSTMILDSGEDLAEPGLSYLRVYFNPTAPTVADIDEADVADAGEQA